jgi:hypothetical protein
MTVMMMMIATTRERERKKERGFLSPIKKYSWPTNTKKSLEKTMRYTLEGCR